MSGTILYLAIVAIWVCILVPRWMRRSHPAADTPDDAVSAAPATGAAGTADYSSGHQPGGRAAASVTMASATVTETAYWTADEDAGPEYQSSAPLAAPVCAEPADYQETYAESLTVTTESVSIQADPPAEADYPPPAAATPPLSRAHVLQARRRLLSTLVALAAIAYSFTVIGLARWWVCVPPTVMLGFYLPMLREAALADAENDRRQAEARQAQRARQRAQALRAAEAARAAQAAQAVAAQPQAQIIDISARITDQLYDQYADATIRAVGD